MSREDYARRRRDKTEHYRRINAGTSRLDRWRRSGREQMLARAREHLEAAPHACQIASQGRTEAERR